MVAGIRAQQAGKDQGKVAINNCVAGLGRKQAEEVLRQQRETRNTFNGIRNGVVATLLFWLGLFLLAVFWPH